MPITFSKEYTPPPSPDQDMETEARNPISFHRHCQATVCSAFGTDTGNGRSWHILDDLDSLSNLPHGWKNYFIQNKANITQDFASVLKIIDSVAGQRYAGFDFEVRSGSMTIPLHIEAGAQLNLGRDVHLSIDGESLSFNTLKQGDTEVLSMELKRNPLSFIYDGEVLGSVSLPMSDAQEIDLSSIKGAGGSPGTGEEPETPSIISGNYFPEEIVDELVGIKVSDKSSVYRMQTDSDFAPTIDMSQYEGYDSGMVRFQVVVENTGENIINIYVPVVKQDTFFVNPVMNNGTLNPGTVGVFSVVVDMRNRIVSMNRDGEYISNPSYLTIFQYNCGLSNAVYLTGEITQKKLRDAGILDYDMNWVDSPIGVLLGQPVTAIGDDAFSGCSDLVTICGNTMSRSANQNNSIPNHITRIGARAFKGCSSLRSLVVNEEVTSIGQECFAECSSLEELTLPFIGQDAQATGANAVLGHLFGTTSPSDVDKFASVTQKYGSASSTIVRYIPNSLVKIALNNNVEYGIPYGAFHNCTMLSEVVLNDKTSMVGEYAFIGCTNIRELEIPDSVTYIAPASLAGTSSLEHLKIPFIGTSADSTQYNQLFGILFQNSTSTPPTGFKKVAQTYSAGVQIKYYFIPESLNEVVLGGSNIGYGAFQNCTMIETVTLSGNPEAIPDRAFKNTGISEIRIPDSVKSVGSESFMTTPSLSRIYIGNGLNTIGKDAFNSTGASQYGMKVYVDSAEQWLDMKYNNPASEGSYPFGKTAFSAFEANNPQGSNYLYEKGSDGEYREVESVFVEQDVNPYSFCGCKHIHNVDFSLRRTQDYNIGDYAFYHCENITGNAENLIGDEEDILWIFGDTFSIGTGAFQGCKRLSRVWIGSMESDNTPTRVSIGQYAFNGCYGTDGEVETGIGEVVIRNANVVGNYSFQGCSRLRKLEFINTAPDIITRSSNKGFGTGTLTAFYGCPIEELSINDNCHLTATANYTLASLFGNQIKTLLISSGVTEIPVGALKGLENLQTLNVPFVGKSNTATGKDRSMGAIFGTATYGTIDKTTYIAVYEGSNPSSLTDDTKWIVPMSLATINVTSDSGKLPDQAFQHFRLLKSVSLNDGITQIGNKAFLGCESLGTINFAGNITSIGDRAFLTSGIKRMEMPYVTHIGSRAFYNCQNIDYVQFNGITNPDEILEYAFYSSETTIREVHLEGLTLEQITSKKDYWGLSCAQLHSSDGVINYS